MKRPQPHPWPSPTRPDAGEPLPAPPLVAFADEVLQPRVVGGDGVHQDRPEHVDVPVEMARPVGVLGADDPRVVAALVVRPELRLQ